MSMAPSDAELLEDREDAESRMLSMGAVHRPAGTFTTDANRLQIPAWTIVHAGKCRIAGGGTQSSAGTSATTDKTAGQSISRSSMIAHFPIGTELRDGDLIDVTAGESAGLVFRVVEADQGDQRTAGRVRIIQTERPAEWGLIA